MEMVGRSEIERFSATRLREFLVVRDVLTSNETERFEAEGIDGEAFFELSQDELRALTGITLGKSKKVLKFQKALQSSDVRSSLVVQRAPEAMSVPHDHIVEPYGHQLAGAKTCEMSNFSRESSALQVPKPADSVTGTNGTANRSETRTCKKRKSTDPLPEDPVQDLDELYERVFTKKPASVFLDQWGKGYLEAYHPRAHGAYNRNVDLMRSFFADVRDPQVQKFWTTSFQQHRDVKRECLAFITSKATQLEDLHFTIRGLSVSIRWKPEDILQRWFLEHKKHTPHRLREIEELQYEDLMAGEFVADGLPAEDEDADAPSEQLTDTTMAPARIPLALPGLNEALEDTTNKPEVGCPTSRVDDAVHGHKLVSRGYKVGQVEQIDTAEPARALAKRGPTVTTGAEVNSQNSMQMEIEDKEHQPHHEGVSPIEELAPGPLKAMPNLSRIRKPSAKMAEAVALSNLKPNSKMVHAQVSSPIPLLKTVPLQVGSPDYSVPSSGSDYHSDYNSPMSITSTETDDSVKLVHEKKPLASFYPDNLPVDKKMEPAANRSKLPTVRNILGESNSKISRPSLHPKRSRAHALESDKENCPDEQRRMNIVLSDLDEEGKRTIAAKAMGLFRQYEVNSKLKAFIATQNQKVQAFNDRTKGAKLKLPFSGHQKIVDSLQLLDLVVDWALKYRVNIVNSPVSVNGVVKIFAHHVVLKTPVQA